MGKFKVGDRVRAIADEDGEGKGKTAVIIGMCHPEWAHVRFDDPIDGWGEDGQEWGFSTSKLEPVAAAQQPQPLRIREGRYYRTRDGRKVGPATPSGDTDYPWWVGESTYTDSGAWVGGLEDDNDLVAEADEPQSTKEILDGLEAWIAEQDAIKAAGKGSARGSTAGFTVPVFDEDDFDICGHRDSDDDIVQLSVGELTAALADSLKVARKVGKTIKRGDLVMLARPALVTGIDRYHASVQTDGGNYSLPLAALTTA